MEVDVITTHHNIIIKVADFLDHNSITIVGVEGSDNPHLIEAKRTRLGIPPRVLTTVCSINRVASTVQIIMGSILTDHNPHRQGTKILEGTVTDLQVFKWGPFRSGGRVHE